MNNKSKMWYLLARGIHLLVIGSLSHGSSLLSYSLSVFVAGRIFSPKTCRMKIIWKLGEKLYKCMSSHRWRQRHSVCVRPTANVQHVSAASFSTALIKVSSVSWTIVRCCVSNTSWGLNVRSARSHRKLVMWHCVLKGKEEASRWWGGFFLFFTFHVVAGLRENFTWFHPKSNCTWHELIHGV